MRSVQREKMCEYYVLYLCAKRKYNKPIKVCAYIFKNVEKNYQMAVNFVVVRVIVTRLHNLCIYKRIEYSNP